MADLCTLSGTFCDPAGSPFGGAKLVIRPVSTQPTVREDGSIVAAVAVSSFETAEDGAVTIGLAPGLYRGSATESAGGRSFAFDLAVPDLQTAPLEDYIGRIDVEVQTSAQKARDQAVQAVQDAAGIRGAVEQLFEAAGGVVNAVAEAAGSAAAAAGSAGAAAAAAADANQAKAGAETAAGAAAADRALAQAAAGSAQASALTCSTWAVLSGLTGATAGTGAEVLDTDAGTHTDPVVGGTVSNAGRYSWSASPAGWRRIGATGLSSKAPLASPALTGTPTAPTAAAGTNTTQIATTAFVAPIAAGFDLITAQVGNPLAAAFVAETTANGRHSIYRASGALVVGNGYRLTAIVQGVGRNAAFYSASGPDVRCQYNLETGIASTPGGIATPAMELIGPNTWRIVAEFVAAATTASNMQLSTVSGTSESFAGSITKGLRVVAFKFENLTAGAAIWAFSGYGDAGFTLSNATSAADTTDTTTLPVALKSVTDQFADTYAAVFGSQTMTKLVEAADATATPTIHTLMTPANGDDFMVKVGCKAGERKRLRIFNNSPSIGMDAMFDLRNGTAALTTGGSASLRHIGVGCYEAIVTVTSTGTVNGNLQLQIYPDIGGQPYVGDGASGLFIQYVEIWKNGALVQRATDLSGWGKIEITPEANEGVWLGMLDSSSEPVSDDLPLRGKKLSLVGTSLVAQGHLTSALALATGATIQQLGSSGGALGLDARGSPHYGSGAVTALFGTINSDAEVIVLDMCVNDIAASDVPLGVVSDTTTATYYGALANFFAWCEANRPNAAVCVVVPTAASPAYPVSDYRHGAPNANGATVEDFQNATRRAALYAGRPCIDPNAYGVGYLDMETGEATSDGLHWDASGAAKIAKIYHKQMVDFCEAGWLTPA